MRGDVLRLGLVGAGAVGESRYLPAAARVSGLEVTHVVDLDLERARSVAREHGVAAATDDHRSILGQVDAVVVATPPVAHRTVSVDFLRNGVHVLCEKPLTPDRADGEAMVAAARESAAILSVAMVRRYGRGPRLLHEFVELGLAGEIRRVDAEEGGGFTWPQRTSHIFEMGQGGVLRDTGSHLLDLVFWISGAEGARVSRYQDDSLGGPEANARVDLDLDTLSGTAEASVEVSFTRGLRNRIRVEGSQGVLVAPTSGGTEVEFTPTGSGERIRLVPEDVEPRSRVDDFVLQLEDFVAAIRSSGPPPIPAESALLPLEIIEHCHRSRTVTVHPWDAPPDSDGEGGEVDSPYVEREAHRV